jgi:transcription initiation factor IIF auxiliary subunit
VKQRTAYRGKDWWEWSVWLDGRPEELDAVKEVEYTLHPTFADPVRTVRKRSNGFRVDSAGWGEFEIYIRIIRRDGKIAKRTYELKLDYPDAKGAAGDDEKRTTEPRKGTRKKSRKRGGRATAVPIKSRARAKEEAPSMPESVFVSSGAADAQLARELKAELTHRGVRVTSVEDTKVGVPIESAIKRAIEGADAAVFLISGRPSLWTNFEIDYAMGRDGRVVPVLVGDAHAPEPLRSSSAVRVTRSDEIASIANDIVAATRTLKSQV